QWPRPNTTRCAEAGTPFAAASSQYVDLGPSSSYRPFDPVSLGLDPSWRLTSYSELRG
uniref:Uncharacterized protein n=1 Tax=Coturnix japonica TaxID=93934 RepID=A0A8C2Y4L3_COTJA